MARRKRLQGEVLRATTLKVIEEMTVGRLIPAEAENLVVDSVAFDSRKISKGGLFFALVGDRDGHDFIRDAIDNGAVAAVVSKDTKCEIPIIRVDDTLLAFGELAKGYRGSLSAKMTGITGSLGKTTCRRVVSKVLSSKFETSESKGNFNNLIGLPVSILEIEDRHEAAVMEVGINTPGEMTRLAEILEPDYAVVLNIAPVHLEGLRSLDDIAREKLHLLKSLRPKGKAFLNIDDERLANQRIVPRERVVGFGFRNSADFRITDIALLEGHGTAVTIGKTRIETRLFGRGAAYAICCAFAIGIEHGIKESEIAEALTNFEGLPDRLCVRHIGDLVLICDVYNSSPMAVESALETLSAVKAERKIAVLGDMLELGNEAVEFHKKAIVKALESGVQRLYLYGELFLKALEESSGIREYGAVVFASCDFDELKHEVMTKIDAGDVILVKGSRAMRLERLSGAILNNYEK
jgi:UDP-N-acetylmuramoyl-tripeptide--D-alanyl-D-alanine ligase